jgi:hypothetical protein
VIVNMHGRTTIKIMPFVNNSFTFFKSAYYVKFLFNTARSSSAGFSLGLHWVVQSYVPLSMLLLKGKLNEPRFCHQRNKFIHATVAVTSLSASLLRKISAATDRLCQVALNRKL